MWRPGGKRKGGDGGRGMVREAGEWEGEMGAKEMRGEGMRREISRPRNRVDRLSRSFDAGVELSRYYRSKLS